MCIANRILKINIPKCERCVINPIIKEHSAPKNQYILILNENNTASKC